MQSNAIYTNINAHSNVKYNNYMDFCISKSQNVFADQDIGQSAKALVAK